MSEEAIIEAITPVFRTVFENNSLIITRDLNASRVTNWDSLNHISLIVGLEELMGQTFSVEELASMANVGDLIDILKRKGFKN